MGTQSGSGRCSTVCRHVRSGASTPGSARGERRPRGPKVGLASCADIDAKPTTDAERPDRRARHPAVEAAGQVGPLGGMRHHTAVVLLVVAEGLTQPQAGRALLALATGDLRPRGSGPLPGARDTISPTNHSYRRVREHHRALPEAHGRTRAAYLMRSAGTTQDGLQLVTWAASAALARERSWPAGLATSTRSASPRPGCAGALRRGEDPDHVGPAADLAVETLERLRNSMKDDRCRP